MQYKRTKNSLGEIARELNVDAVVEGEVLRGGDRVRMENTSGPRARSVTYVMYWCCKVR
jgi:hypothetical protein